jgi:hypothetical protein
MVKVTEGGNPYIVPWAWIDAVVWDASAKAYLVTVDGREARYTESDSGPVLSE